MEGNHLVISCNLIDGINRIRTHALVDCGATGYAFIDESFTRHHNLPLFPLKTPRSLEVIDGRPIESGDITHMTRLRLDIDQHTEEIPMFVTKLGHYPIVLGIPWLKWHDVAIRFATNTVTFDSDFCLHHCVEAATTTKGISIPIPEHQPHRIAMIAASMFCRQVKKHDLHVFSATVHEIDQAINQAINPEKPLSMEPDKVTELVPSQYHQYLPLFNKAMGEQLPPH